MEQVDAPEITSLESSDSIPAVGSSNGPTVTSREKETTSHGLDEFETAFKTESVSIPGSIPLMDHGLRLVEQEKDSIFSRPVVIAVFSWDTTMTAFSYDAHRLWFNDPMILQRMKGALFWRGTLHLRFDIAASPHQYGLARAFFSYMTVLTGAGGDANPFGLDWDSNAGLSYSSQKYGVDFDAAVPGGKEMVIPWVYPYECALTTVTKSLDFLGRLTIVPIIGLGRDDSATPGTVQIVVRAWMTDLHLWGATRYSAVAQAPTRKSGMVGSLAGKVAEGAKYIEMIPGFDKMGSAVALGASAVKSIADLFGFSREKESETHSVHSKNYSSMALTDTLVTADSCAFTKSCGLTKDLRNIGVSDGDEMALSRIFSHRSIVQTATWTQAQTRGTTVMTIAVDPTCSLNTGTGYWDPTSLAYGVLPFQFWRGSLVFCIRVVSSQFHTGKLRAYFEPGVIYGTTEDTTWPLASVENCTMDCTPGSCTEIVVGWTSDETWLPVESTFTNPGTVTGAGLGYIRVVVENPLIAPLSTSSVGIVVYVCGGDDFQVFGVKETIPRYAVQAQAASIVAGGEEGMATDLDFVGQSVLVPNNTAFEKVHFGGTYCDPELSKKIFGEEVRSLRALLKRYVGMARITVATDALAAGAKSITATFPMYPPDFGHLASTGNALTYLNSNNLFRWFRIGYIGCKGGMRYRITDTTPDYDNTGSGVGRSQFSFGTSLNPGIATNLTAAFGFDGAAAGTSGSGVVTANGELLHEADFEMPDYNDQVFFPMLAATSDVAFDLVQPYVTVKILKFSASTKASSTSYSVNSAVSDDFSFFGWQGPLNVKGV